MKTDPKEMTLIEILYRAADSEFGIQLVDGSSRTNYSYRQLLEHAQSVAAHLQQRGFEKGDRVAIIQPLPGDFAASYFGTLLAGGIAVPIYPPPSLKDLNFFFEASSHVLRAAKARYLITDRKLGLLTGPLQHKSPELQHVLDIHKLKDMPEKHQKVTRQLSDVAMLQFTSGSTLAPKGVRLTHQCLAENIEVIRKVGVKLSAADQAVSWLPLYHDMGLIGFLLTPLVQRINVALMSPVQFLMNPQSWLELMTELRGTISFGPNFAYAYTARRIRDAALEKLDLSSWRVAGCGAEPIQRATLEGFANRFASVGFNPGSFTPCYGLAEFTLAATFCPLGRGLKIDRVDADALSDEGYARAVGENDVGLELVSCGSAVPGHQLEIIDDAGHPLPDRRVGQIRLHGPSMSQGYEGVESQAFRDGWLYTGDLGYLDQGELYVCGRQRDIIKSRGRTYYPHDLEWAASHVEGLRSGSVAAFGVQDGTTEKVVIAAETKSGVEIGPVLRGQVVRAVSDAVGVMVDDVVLVKSGILPKTSSGKIRRAAVQTAYLEGKIEGNQKGLMAAGAALVSAQWYRLFSRSERSA